MRFMYEFIERCKNKNINFLFEKKYMKVTRLNIL